MFRSIIVTGGAGFVGSHLIRALAAQYPDASITSIDNYFLGDPDRHHRAPGVRYLTGHAKDIARLCEVMEIPNPDIVFHLGEYSRVTQSFDDYHRVWDYNMAGTKAVIDFSATTGAKLVYSASSSKFGNNGDDEHLNPYAWIKAKNGELIRNYATWFSNLDYVICYFFNVYGPGQLGAGKYAGVIGKFTEQYRHNEPLSVVLPGNQTRDFTHIEDTVSGLLACALHGNGDGYQIGRGQEHSVLDVAAMFDSVIRLAPPLRGERERGRADNRKVIDLGWTPRHTLTDYIAAIKAAQHETANSI